MSGNWKVFDARYSAITSNLILSLYKLGDGKAEYAPNDTVTVLTEADVAKLHDAVKTLTDERKNWFSVEEAKDTIKSIINPE